MYIYTEIINNDIVLYMHACYRVGDMLPGEVENSMKR